MKHVTNALNAIEGAADVTVSLEAKTATLSVPETVTDEMLKAAVTEEGYQSDRNSDARIKRAIPKEAAEESMSS